MRRAVFLDRDGVLNALVVDPDHGCIDSPMHRRQLRLMPRVGQAVNLLNRLGFLVIVVSNQPGVAKGKQRRGELDAMTRRLVRSLRRSGGGRLDDVLYCLHHPQARRRELRQRCRCRKPAPGLLRQAARRWRVALRDSYMVGDGVNDMEAGRRVGCTRIWVGDLRCEFCRAARHRVKPDHVVPDLWGAAQLIRRLEARA